MIVQEKKSKVGPREAQLRAMREANLEKRASPKRQAIKGAAKRVVKLVKSSGRGR
jgi:hypothetical protein